MQSVDSVLLPRSLLVGQQLDSYFAVQLPSCHNKE
jgi:hypothetical protein